MRSNQGTPLAMNQYGDNSVQIGEVTGGSVIVNYFGAKDDSNENGISEELNVLDSLTSLNPLLIDTDYINSQLLSETETIRYYAMYLKVSDEIDLLSKIVCNNLDVPNEEALLKARKSIKDPNYHFKSDTSISDYKKMLHMYHLTKSDGKNIWKYQIIDFTKSNDEEVLIAHMEVKNKVNMTVIYQINAGQIGSHFIMIIKQITGTEEQTICIFPFMCKKTNPENCGLMFGENWDFQLQLFKVIISEKPFAEIKSQKNLSNRECKFLENKWKKGFIWKDFIYDTSQ